uniref:Uncharacterized protein n=1 Tax=Anopheles atroparvus TaxID=41427 RepID=A0AAG5D141_ANOAO
MAGWDTSCQQPAISPPPRAYSIEMAGWAAWIPGTHT